MSPSCRTGSRPAILLRESYRDGDKVKNRTLKNLSDSAGRADPAAARGAARGDAGAGGRGFGDRACLAARTRVGGTRHGAPDRARPAAAAPAGAAAKAGAGADRGAADRSGGQAGDGAGARRDDGDPLTRRDPRAGRGHRQGGLRGARLAGPGSAGDREGARQAPSRGRLPRPLRSHLELSRGPLPRAGALRLQPRRSGATSRRSSSGCCAPPTAARSRSRCSKAIPPIRPRSPVRLPRSRTASG